MLDFAMYWSRNTADDPVSIAWLSETSVEGQGRFLRSARQRRNSVPTFSIFAFCMATNKHKRGIVFFSFMTRIHEQRTFVETGLYPAIPKQLPWSLEVAETLWSDRK